MPHSICAVSHRTPATRRMPHEERLILCYPIEHYDYWKEELLNAERGQCLMTGSRTPCWLKKASSSGALTSVN